MAKRANKPATRTRGSSAVQQVARSIANEVRGAASPRKDADSSTNDAVALLKDDHRRVEDLFEHYETADEADKADIASTVCLELVIHTQLEEEIFYPACREAFDDEEPLNEAAVEHDTAKILIGEIMRSDEDDQFCDARIKVLSQLIRTHVEEEERASDGIFAKAQQAGIDTADLARRLRERKQALQSEARAGELPLGELVSFHVRSTLMQRSAQENSMSMQNSRRGDRRRDDDGDRRYYRSRSRDDDDDRDRLGRRRGGWFGDPEGHAEAARRRWEEDDDRRYSRSRSRDDDDDDRRSSRSRSRDDDDDDDRDRLGRRRGGWFGDPEGHAEAARRRWEEDDDRRYSRSRSRGDDDDDDDRDRLGRRRGGWFGDPEGHAEAARRRWEEDDDRRYSRSRSRDDDDDRDRLGRRRGGWFGDPEGHAEAARRRWEEDDDRRGSRSRSRGR
jgi:hypothetical protein